MSKSKRKQCYSCFEDGTFQYHGTTHNFAKEIGKYRNKIFEDEIIDCGSCGRTVQYKRYGDGWREELIDE